MNSIIVLATIATALGLASEAKAEPQSYALVCRGGNFDYALKPEEDSLFIRFRRGTKPANQGVDSGTCAWRDRGVSTNEPDKICHFGIGFQYVAVGPSLSDKTYLQGSTPATLAYHNLKDASRTQTFQVYSIGECLRVSRVGN